MSANLAGGPSRRALGRVWPWLALACGVILADQLSKSGVQRNLTLGSWLAVNDFFNLVLAYNRGAAFSFLNNASAWQGYVFIGIAAVAAVVIVRLLLRPDNSALFCLALGLILGGALGNAIDRLRYGHVIDFLDFHWRWLEPIFPGGHFPAFNLADSAITAGVTLLILEELLRLRQKS
jgi:signal peptidase II